MVVPPATVVAALLPRAEGAVLDGVRVRRRSGQRVGETRLDGPQVRRDRGVREPLLRSVAEGQDQPTRLDALERRQQLPVERHLDEGRRLRPPSQLRVDHVVGVWPDAAGRAAADQEVRMAQPRAVEKGPLVDDVVAVGQGGHRRPLGLFERRPAERRRPFQLGHPDPGRLEVGQVRRLVLVAVAGREGTGSAWLGQDAGRRVPVQRQEVVTREVAAEIRGAEDERPIEEQHDERRVSRTGLTGGSPAPTARLTGERRPERSERGRRDRQAATGPHRGHRASNTSQHGVSSGLWS